MNKFDMKWDELYTSARKPDFGEISDHIGSKLWGELNNFIQKEYAVSPEITYSKCMAQRGWNVKYKKGGKSLCTLYPEKGFFIALVVVGSSEEMAAEALLSGFSEYTQKLYMKTPAMAMGRWLMIRVTDPKILNDVKTLISIRIKRKNNF